MPRHFLFSLYPGKMMSPSFPVFSLSRKNDVPVISVFSLSPEK